MGLMAERRIASPAELGRVKRKVTAKSDRIRLTDLSDHVADDIPSRNPTNSATIEGLPLQRLLNGGRQADHTRT